MLANKASGHQVTDRLTDQLGASKTLTNLTALLFLLPSPSGNKTTVEVVAIVATVLLLLLLLLLPLLFQGRTIGFQSHFDRLFHKSQCTYLLTKIIIILSLLCLLSIRLDCGSIKPFFRTDKSLSRH